MQVQTNASLRAEKMQTEKQWSLYNSPTQIKIEDLTPSKSIQTAPEKKAELKYYQLRKSGMKHKMQGRTALASGRVPTSQRKTRSQTRSENK